MESETDGFMVRYSISQAIHLVKFIKYVGIVCIEQQPKNEAYSEKPLTDIDLLHDTVEKNTCTSIHQIPFLQSV